MNPCVANKPNSCMTDRQILYMQIDRQVDRQTDRQKDRQTGACTVDRYFT